MLLLSANIKHQKVCHLFRDISKGLESERFTELSKEEWTKWGHYVEKGSGTQDYQGDATQEVKNRFQVYLLLVGRKATMNEEKLGGVGWAAVMLIQILSRQYKVQNNDAAVTSWGNSIISGLYLKKKHFMRCYCQLYNKSCHFGGEAPSWTQMIQIS